MLVSSLTDVDGAKEMRRFYVPVTECEVLDTWDVVAMKATGSHDVVIDEVFVPDHRSILVADMRECNGPGLAATPGPLWRIPLVSFMVLGASGPFIGAAEAMLEIVADVMKIKVGAYSGDKQQGLMSQNMRLARLAAELDAVTRLWEGHAEALWQEVKAGRVPSGERRAEVRYVAAHAAKSCTAIVTELAGSVGSRSYFSDNPIQRFHRDIASLSTHALFEHDHLANQYGATRAGLELPPNAMV